MYVCVCHAVTERQVRDAIADGVHSMHGLRKRLGIAATCGKCARCAHGMLKEQRACPNAGADGKCRVF
ncbi:(2Fe-2S)-binding protein [Parasulfuritortus cantonensis]|uniref:Bacterioferritin-associated ferredoxin n=1 Tax=Parasulfuritortus cantonensis TaxID=2528202 RepID=A0A4R1BED1_9PROT|nr:(2Fe-2S)-binding protein [Parasulfuritortus cantonensis]TCJ15505.1 (2Fe-2S)-binding protein [Parasulfuritortus cantonensis]